MWPWLVTILQKNAELAIFFSLAVGYFIGPLKLAGVTLGYTITYAVSNIVLTVWGAVIVAIFATKTAT